MHSVLIAGCGYVGSRLAELLVERGVRVVGLRRGNAPLPDGVERVCADLARLETLVGLPAGIDTVVYAAGAGAPDERAYREAYVDGPSHLLRALREQGERPRRFVFCSSTAVYGQERGEWIDEESPARPRRWNGEVLLAAEGLVRASGVPSIVVRLGGIYGPGRVRLIERVRRGEARVSPGPQFTNRIHRDDAAGVLAHLVLGAPRYPLYLGVDDDPSDEAEVLRWIAEQLGVPPPPAAEAGPLPQRRAGSKRCRNDRIRSEGYVFRFPSFREGYAAQLGAAT